MRSLHIVVMAAVLSVATAHAQISVGGSVGYLDRRLSVQGAVEHQAGMVAGADIEFHSKVMRLSVSGGGGNLAAQTAVTPDVEYGRLSGDLAVVPTPWFALSGGVSVAAFVSDIGAQRWVLPRLGAELRPTFSSIPAEAYTRGAIIIGATTNSPVEPSGGLSAKGGLLVGGGRFQFFIDYQIERLNFESSTGRQEQRGEIGTGLLVRF